MASDKYSAVTGFKAGLPAARSEKRSSIALVCQRREEFGVKVPSHEKPLKPLEYTKTRAHPFASSRWSPLLDCFKLFLKFSNKLYFYFFHCSLVLHSSEFLTLSLARHKS